MASGRAVGVGDVCRRMPRVPVGAAGGWRAGAHEANSCTLRRCKANASSLHRRRCPAPTLRAVASGGRLLRWDATEDLREEGLEPDRELAGVVLRRLELGRLDAVRVDWTDASMLGSRLLRRGNDWPVAVCRRRPFRDIAASGAPGMTGGPIVNPALDEEPEEDPWPTWHPRFEISSGPLRCRSITATCRSPTASAPGRAGRFAFAADGDVGSVVVWHAGLFMFTVPRPGQVGIHNHESLPVARGCWTEGLL